MYFFMMSEVWALIIFASVMSLAAMGHLPLRCVNRRDQASHTEVVNGQGCF